jgi:hypothetical protein
MPMQRGVKALTLYFIKSPSEVKSILKEPSDGIIISYTAYEQSVLLFKSVQKPVIILNDGNRMYGKYLKQIILSCRTVCSMI